MTIEGARLSDLADGTASRPSPTGSAGHPPAPGSSGDLPEAVGKYRPRLVLGTGAMGVVYLCSQPGLERPVAVKVMIAGRHASPEQIARFRREAWAAAQLAHPNVLQIHDVGNDGALHYFVMEYVDGWPLDRLIGTRELTVERTLRLVGQVAGALEAAHARGIIHRDIKPSNILIDRSGRPRLADFGLAKSIHDGRNLSGSGDIIGTPQYMSPEQALAAPEEVDARTDIYSLGAVLYEMLTGRKPVDGPNALSVLRALIDEEPIPLRTLSPDVPEEVAAVCRRAMAKEKEDRFASAGELAGAIEAYLAGDSTRASATAPTRLSRAGRRPRRRRLGVAIASAVVGVALAVAFAFGLWPAGAGGPFAGGEAPDASAMPPAASSRGANEAGRKSSGAADASAKTLALAREVLQAGGPLGLAGTSAPRDRLKALIEDLTAALKGAPDNPQLRFLRACAYRRAGEPSAAIADFGEALRRDPKDLEAVSGRLLATYQVHVLYLGNLNEPALRPIRPDLVREDVRTLLARGDATLSHEARLVEALAGHDYEGAAKVAEAGPPAGVRQADLPDVLMVEADALFRKAETAYDAEQAAEEGPDKADARRRRQDTARRAGATLRRGLDADPNHVGLLFLQADKLHRIAAWDAEDDERPGMVRRQWLAFEAAQDRLRQTSLIGGCDTAIARAVLLSNFGNGREAQALDRVNDVLTCQPTIPLLHTFRAWLRLMVPPDGPLTVEEVDRILHDHQAASVRPPDEFNADFVRALLDAAAGRWDDARRDLRACRRNLGKDQLPTSVSAYGEWFAQAIAPASARSPSVRFLYATSDVLNYLPVADSLRVDLAEQVLKGLADPKAPSREGIAEDEVRSMKGWTHFRLAVASAAKNDRQGVLGHVREALALRAPDLVPDTFRNDPTISPWNGDEEFAKLYREFGGS